MNSCWKVIVVGAFALVSVALARSATAQSIQVTAANPPSGEQDTVGLVVKITGKNFAKGAKSEFFKSGTTDPAGITVRGTTFVSSTEVDATVDIAAGAALSLFDIKVTNTSGRSGKGSDLFQVIQKGGAAKVCTLEPAGPNFGLVQEFNPGASLYQGMGVSSLLGRARVSAVGGPSNTVLIAALGTNATYSEVEVFALDATSGALLDGGPLCLGCAAQPHVTLTIPLTPDGTAGGAKFTAIGNINGDGVPDFAFAEANAANIFVSTVSSAGVVSWTALPVPRPAGVNNFAWDLALGDVDLDGRDELAVTAIPGGTGKTATSGAVYLYRYANGVVTQIDTITQASVTPALRDSDFFGYSIALGDVTGDGHADVVVSAPWRTVNGIVDAGSVLVLETVSATNANGFSINRAAKVVSSSRIARDAIFGFTVTVAQADGSADGRPDVIVTTKAYNTSTAGGEVFSSPVSNGQTSILAFTPRIGLETGWSTRRPSIGDVNGDGLADVLVGAPNADATGYCISPGMVYLFLATSSSAGGPTTGWTRLSLQAPAPNNGYAAYGWSFAVTDGVPFLIVGERGRIPQGQTYMYQFLP